MDNIRNYDDVRNELLKSVAYYDGLIELWEKVKFPTKKDGSPFKVLSKNFDGAEIGKYYPVESWSEPYLTVCGRVNNGDFTEDHMPIYVKRYDDDIPEHNEEREVRTNDWGSDHEIMTLDEIKGQIQQRIERYRRLKAEAEEALAISEEKFKAVQEKMCEIRDIVYGEDIAGTTLEYALVEYVRGFNKYIR